MFLSSCLRLISIPPPYTVLAVQTHMYEQTTQFLIRATCHAPRSCIQTDMQADMQIGMQTHMQTDMQTMAAVSRNVMSLA